MSNQMNFNHRPSDPQTIFGNTEDHIERDITVYKRAEEFLDSVQIYINLPEFQRVRRPFCLNGKCFEARDKTESSLATNTASISCSRDIIFRNKENCNEEQGCVLELFNSVLFTKRMRTRI